MKKILPWFVPLFRTLLFIAGGSLLMVLTNSGDADLMKWWSPLCTVFNLITILFLFLICRYEKVEFKSLFNRSNEKIKSRKTIVFILIMLFIGVGGMLGFSLLFYQELPEFLVQPIPIWIAVVNLFLLPVTIVFSELPLYFGYSLNRINENTNKPILAIAYTVFFYALQHSFIPLFWDVKYMLFRFLSFIPLMLFLGIYYYKKQNLKQMMVGHGVMDLSTSAQILLMSIL